jgi:hypothetical protein
MHLRSRRDSPDLRLRRQLSEAQTVTVVVALENLLHLISLHRKTTQHQSRCLRGYCESQARQCSKPVRHGSGPDLEAFAESRQWPRSWKAIWGGYGYCQQPSVLHRTQDYSKVFAEGRDLNQPGCAPDERQLNPLPPAQQPALSRKSRTDHGSWRFRNEVCTLHTRRHPY